MTAKPRDDRADWPLGHLRRRGSGQTPAGERDLRASQPLGPGPPTGARFLHVFQLTSAPFVERVSQESETELPGVSSTVSPPGELGYNLVGDLAAPCPSRPHCANGAPHGWDLRRIGT